MEPDIELYFRSVGVSNRSMVLDTKRIVRTSSVGIKSVREVVRGMDAVVGRNAQGVLMPDFGGPYESSFPNFIK